MTTHKQWNRKYTYGGNKWRHWLGTVYCMYRSHNGKLRQDISTCSGCLVINTCTCTCQCERNAVAHPHARSTNLNPFQMSYGFIFVLQLLLWILVVLWRISIVTIANQTVAGQRRHRWRVAREVRTGESAVVKRHVVVARVSRRWAITGQAVAGDVIHL